MIPGEGGEGVPANEPFDAHVGGGSTPISEANLHNTGRTTSAQQPTPAPLLAGARARAGSSSGNTRSTAARLAGSLQNLPPHRRRRRHHHRTGGASEQVLDAAALQDHLMRRMKLDLGGQQPRAVLVVGESAGGGSGRHTDRVRRRRFGGGNPGGGSDANADDNATTTARRPGAGASTAWTCQACSAENYSDLGATANGRSSGGGGSDICAVCVQHRQWRRPSAADTGACVHGEGGSDGRAENQERQQRRKVAVTLAQIRGLEEPPEPTLTAGEWSVVEAKAFARGNEATVCPICRETFRDESQVILNCSHVFHKACLSSFENFLRARERSCPLCRKVDYQKRATSQGAVAWRQQCARRLQCAYRRHRARRNYRLLLRRHYAAGFGDAARRREFLSGQAAQTAGRLAEALEDRGDSIDRLFGEFDRSLAFSREVFGPVAARTSSPNSSVNVRRRSTGGQVVGNGVPEFVPGKPERDKTLLWNDAWRKAEKRGEDECPICMGSMVPILAREEGPQSKGVIGADQEVRSPSSSEETAGESSASRRDRTTNIGAVEVGGGQGNRGERGGRRVLAVRQQQQREKERCGTNTATTTTDRRGGKEGRERRRRPVEAGDQRQTLLLSCSHVFHKACLEAFEGFNIYDVHLCPVCRQEYESVDPGLLNSSITYHEKLTSSMSGVLTSQERKK
eukprot:g10696.t1